ncbi:sperm-associated antigen 17 [Amphiprion ocellaris]|uniref:Sperm-associated antigen 17 n=1 Tax=Amphiprion ocellaris TaxID=80972 RepID=A0AAQ6AQR8_AMPOC|nr:sperm-associated antigen 17 [Amphiprion ocellaris]
MFLVTTVKMPPKAAKRGSAGKSNTRGAGKENWEAGLIKAPFEEDSWKACVSLVVGGSPEEEELIQALTLAVQQSQCKLFSLITWDSTLAKIHEVGNPKAKKTDGTPMYYEVTEPAKVLLDAGEEIPCDLMAKILKFQLLQIKSNDQQRREAEQGKGKAAPSRQEPSKEKKTKLKRRGEVELPVCIDDEPDCGPQHYVLVLGFYQPHLIRLLDAMGVHVANVIKLCSKHFQSFDGQQEQHSCEENEQSLRASSVSGAEENVCGSAELAVKAKKVASFWSCLRAILDSGPPDSKLHDVVQLSYTVPDLLLPFHKQAVLELGSQIFGGVAKLIYASLDWRRQHQHYRDNVKLIHMPTVLGLDSHPVKDLPTVLPTTPCTKSETVQKESRPDQETKLPPLSLDVDMRYYNNLLDLVPPEACSVPLILHCMLEQVVISTEQPLHTASHMVAETKPVSGSWSDHEQVSYMLQTFLPLLHTEEERSHLLSSLLTTVQNEEDKKRLVEKFGARKTQKKSEQPLVIRHHDERALRLRDIKEVQGFDPAKVELSMMKMTPVWELIQSVAQQRKSNSCWMAIRQQLQHYCTDDTVSWPEVERLCHQSVFETMPLTRLDQQGVLVNAARPLGTLEPAQQQTSIIPWDNPTSYAKHQLHNLQNKGPTFPTEHPDNTEHFSGRVCSQLKLSDIQSCRLRSLFDWHYAEHHDAIIFPQVLQSASEEYRCLDTFRGSHKSILYIFCHNPMSPQRQSKEFWNVALHTDVKFRKYLEHVADTISNWTTEEELKREAMQIKNHSPVDPPKEEEETLGPVIRKDSLKAWLLEKERLKEQDTTKKSKEDNTAKAKQQKEKQEDKKKSKISSAGKKSRPQTAGSSAKTPTKSFTANAPPVDENKDLHQTEEPSNSFTGYSMDGKLIHVSGCLQYLFPSDGGQITVENVSFVEGSSHMVVDVKKDGHHFYTHINQIVGDPAKPPPQPQDKKNADPKEDCKVLEPVEMKRVKQGSFSALLDNRIHLSYSFYGPTGEHAVSSQETKGGIPETSVFDPIPASSSNRHSKGTDLESLTSTSETPSSQIRPPESKGCEGQPALPSSLFNSLSMSVPNGLVLQFLREDAKGIPPEENGILVRQSYPLYSRGEVRHLQDISLSKELSRIITSQGTVIRSMRDGSTEVLFADGSVSFSQDSGPVWVSDSEVQDENSHQEAEDKEKEQNSEKEAEAQRGCWLTTAPSGECICTVGTTHKQIPTTSLLSFKATDPFTHQVMLTREDLMVSVQNPDGSLIVEHADGTRITNIPETVHTCAKLSEIVQMCDYREYAGSSTAKNGKRSMFTEKTVTENSLMSECETEKEDMPTKERVVLVEKEGCATVVMYPERHTAHIFLADGTVITGTNQGEYQVFPSSVGLLQIQRDGKCLYSSDPVVTPSPKGCPPTNQPGTYTMSHTDKVACDLTEPDGNHFQVMEDGQIAVVISSPAPSTLKHDEEELEEEEDREMARLHEKHREHCPRLFLVHEDGSGTELLSSCTVEELLHQVHSDHTIALLKEPLPDTQDEFGITILKPIHQSVWSQWLLGKQNPNITPPSLTNRSWHDFPCGKNSGVTKKSPCPPFGTDLGRGLTLRESSGGSAAQHQPVRNCPKVLEMREIQQHRPFTTPLKHTIDSRLREYIESLMEREQRSEEVKIKDPRSEEESAQASDLLSRILSFTEEDNASQSTDKRLSVDVASLYSQGVGAPAGKSAVLEDTATTDTNSLEDIKRTGNRKDSKWTERLAQHRQEISEERRHREALRKKSIVPFFHPENISLFKGLLEPQIPDMRRLSMDLPSVPKSDSAATFLKDAPQDSTPRPLNPTPSQSTSHPAGSGRTPEKRPTKPTPQTAGESSLRDSSKQCKSVQVDVTGKPRQSEVRLPTSILSSKPYSIPNQQFLTVEEPVRRKCRTISLANPSTIVRGFQLLPESVDFGTLQEGTTSTITVVMKNVGVDTCRFHVKQPSPNTGLRVIYKPGPVAAGLQVELQVQLFAMCAAQTGEVEPKTYISQDVIINTERDIFYLPVTANIL